MSLRDEITTILNSEGAASEGGWHSWRCFDKDRYPEPCHCTEVVAEMVVNAALDAARDAVAAMENVGGYPPSDFDHIRQDVVDVIAALREGEK